MCAFTRRVIKVSPENIDALNTLKNIYGVLGNNEGFMQLKAKIEEFKLINLSFYNYNL